MPLKNLNHYLIRARDVDATRDFYRDILGLTQGERPPFQFRGYWMYIGDRAVVHLAERAPGAEAGDTGAIDHIAFEAAGLTEMLERLKTHGVPARNRKVPGQGLHQVFVTDPDGVMIELNYAAAEGEGVEAD